MYYLVSILSALGLIFKDKCAPILEWSLSNPPKPHAFTSLPLQSSARPSGNSSDNSNDSSSDEGELIDEFAPSTSNYAADFRKLCEHEVDRYESVREVARKFDNGEELTSDDQEALDKARPHLDGVPDPSFPERPSEAFIDSKVDYYEERIDHFTRVIRGESEASFDAQQTDAMPYTGPAWTPIQNFDDPNNQDNNLLPIVILDIPLLRIIFTTYTLYRLNLFSVIYSQVLYYSNTHTQVTPYILIGLSFLFVVLFIILRFMF